jgi:pSer/pThr/pTyr-binding forkhead associated (FHA) protein
MTRPAPSLEPGSLVVRTNGFSYVVSPRAGVATRARDPHAQVKIDDARISRVHVRVEFVDGTWRAVDTSMNGMFLGRSRAHSVAVTDGLTVRLGDPVAGPTVQFEVVPVNMPVLAELDDPEHTTLVEPDDDATVALHPGMVRAGAAAAARRRELDISQLAPLSSGGGKCGWRRRSSGHRHRPRFG